MSRRRILEGCDVLPPMKSDSGKAAVGPPKRQRKTTRGRFGVLNTFIDFTIGNLSRADMAVWLVLYRDTKNGIAQTAQTDIARRAGVTRRTVVRALHRLAKLGLVVVVHHGGLNRGVSSYRVVPLNGERDV